MNGAAQQVQLSGHHSAHQHRHHRFFGDKRQQQPIRALVNFAFERSNPHRHLEIGPETPLELPVQASDGLARLILGAILRLQVLGEQRLILATGIYFTTRRGKRMEAHWQAFAVAIDQFTLEHVPGARLLAMIVMQRRRQQRSPGATNIGWPQQNRRSAGQQ
ncbi:hypothetical protein D3C79_838600 [compost metagenome]